MPITPEDKARQKIDHLLEAAGWKIQDRRQLNLSLPGGVAVREFPMPGFGEADYLLFVDGKALGVVEAKKQGETLTHVETQTQKYSAGLPDYVDAPVKPLPFRYESTGVETRFTNGLEPEAASHNIFAFHKPETLADWLDKETSKSRLRHMPPLAEEGLRPAQIAAIKNLERYFNSENARRFSTGVAFGTTRLRVTLPLFRSVPVPLPPLAEQRRIVQEIERRQSMEDAARGAIESESLRTVRLRQSILRAAFSGKLVPQHPNEEPASVLLERIRAERARAQEQKQKTPRATNGASPKDAQRRRRIKELAQGVSPGKG